MYGYPLIISEYIARKSLDFGLITPDDFIALQEGKSVIAKNFTNYPELKIEIYMSRNTVAVSTNSMV